MSQQPHGPEPYEAPRWITNAIRMAREGLRFLDKGIVMQGRANLGQQRMRTQSASGLLHGSPVRRNSSVRRQSAKSRAEPPTGDGPFSASGLGFGLTAPPAKSTNEASVIARASGSDGSSPRLPSQPVKTNREQRGAVQFCAALPSGVKSSVNRGGMGGATSRAVAVAGQAISAAAPKRVTLVMEAPRLPSGQQAAAAPLRQVVGFDRGSADAGGGMLAPRAVAALAAPGGFTRLTGSQSGFSPPGNVVTRAHPTSRLAGPNAPTGGSRSEAIHPTGRSPEWLPPAAMAVSGEVANPVPNESSSAQAPADQMAPASAGGPTEGDVYLDGALVGRWMARFLAQAAGQQPSGSAAFDPTRSRLPSGAMIGV